MTLKNALEIVACSDLAQADLTARKLWKTATLDYIEAIGTPEAHTANAARLYWVEVYSTIHKAAQAAGVAYDPRVGRCLNTP